MSFNSFPLKGSQQERLNGRKKFMQSVDLKGEKVLEKFVIDKILITQTGWRQALAGFGGNARYTQSLLVREVGEF